MGKEGASHHHHHEGEHHTHDNPLDFSKKHPIFDVHLDKKGPEFSHIDDLRAEYIAKYAGKLNFDVPVPKNIPGLVPRNGPLPATRRWWRPSTSFERNGVFNLHTKTLNTRIGFPFFFCFLLYGWYGHAMMGRHYELYHDNGETNENVYDKLNYRQLPNTKIWLRPA